MNSTSFFAWWAGRNADVQDEAADAMQPESSTLRRLRVALWLVVSIVALLPIFLVRFAPLYDYYNWLYQGRIVADLLHAGPDAYASAHHNYTLDWRPIPNLAAPLGIGLLTMMMSLDTAGRVFLAVCVLLFAYGYAYLVRTIQGRATAMELFGFPWAFGYSYYKGYDSYLIALPLAFIAIARLHRIYARRSPEPTMLEVAGIAVLCAVLFLCHLLAWSVFAVALAVYGGLLIRRGDHRWASRLATSTAPTLVMLLSYTLSRLQGHRSGSEFYQHLGLSRDKIISMVEPVMLFLRADPFSPLMPLFLVNAGALALLALVVVANVERRHGLARPAFFTALAVGGIALVLPFAVFVGENRPDERFVLPAILIGLAALPWKAFSARRGAGLALVIVGILALHVAEDTHASRLAVRISEATAAAVPADATVLSLTIHEGPTHGGCSGGGGPTIGAASLRWLELRRLERMAPRRIDLLDTSFVRARAIDPDEPRLAVQDSSLDGIRSQPDLAAQLAQQYPYIEVFGCQKSIEVVRTQFASSYQQVAAGDNYVVLATSNGTP